MNRATDHHLVMAQIEGHMTVFVTTMYRYGNHELHSYVLGVWSTHDIATRAGETEALWRGGKYEAEVTEWIIDANEFDNIEDK